MTTMQDGPDDITAFEALDGTEDEVTFEEVVVPEAALAAPVDPGEAREADQEFEALLGVVREPLARLAVLIHRIKDRALYKGLAFDSFEAYIASKRLQFSRSFIYQLAKVGRMLDSVGVDPAAIPESQLEITKLAQIARLADPLEQRQVVETGFFPVGDESRHLADIPVRELSGLVDLRLGKEPRGGLKPLSESYEEGDIPWEGPNRFGDDDRSAVAQPVHGATRVVEGGTSWQHLVDELASVVRGLEPHDRDAAINAISRLYNDLVSY
jgi:hypothetical protein